MPEDAKEAIGHGIRAKRSKSGSVGRAPARSHGARLVAWAVPVAV